MTDQMTIGLTFCIYMLVMGAIGAAAYLRTRDLSQYILGGRSLGPWVAALSAGASDMSGWLLMGLPGLAYTTGLGSLWIAIGLLCGTYYNWRLMANRLRAFTIVAADSLTLPSYLHERFACAERHTLRSLAALVILIFFSIYTSSGLIAGGKLFEEVFHLPYRDAVLLATLAILSYTLFGGFLAVSWNDMVQGLMMSSALVMVPAYGFYAAGQHGDAWSAFHRFTEMPWFGVFSDKSGDFLAPITLVSLLGWGLGYFGQPHILCRFKAVRSASAVPAATRIGTTWTAFCLLGAMFSGLAALSYFGAGLADPERAFMDLVNKAFHPAVAGFLLAAVLAAIMSTAASQLLVASSILAEDFYKASFRQQASAKELMTMGRISVVVITVVAYFMAMGPDNLVLDVVAYAWAGFGAAFGPVLLGSLFWRRMSATGAMAGILCGGITVILWRHTHGGIFELYEIIPGILVASVAVFAGSRWAPPSPIAQEVFDRGERLIASESSKPRPNLP